MGFVHSFLALLLLFVVTGRAAFSFPVYRSLQYRQGGEEKGSRGAAMSLSLSPIDSDALARKVVILRLKDLQTDCKSFFGRGMGGVLVVLPEAEQTLSDDDVKKFNRLETYLVEQSVPIPVFFTHESEELRRVELELERPRSFDDIELSVAGPTEAPFVKGAKIASYHGWLQGISSAVDMLQLPTVAVIAHYDTLGAAVDLATGANSNGSGLAAVLELARLFSRLYQQPRNRVAVNFLFVVTGGSKLNYAGTDQWLKSLDSQVLDRIDFALCLDSLASQDKGLHLHYSRPAKTPKIKAVYDLFVENAELMDIPLEFHRRKINIDSDLVAFEHEIFAKKHILAMTLSGKEGPSTPSSLDSYQKVDVDILARNIAFVGEILFKHAFGFGGKRFRVFNDGSLAVDKHSVTEWMKIISSTSRVEYMLDKGVGQSVVLDLVRNRLSDYLEHFANRTYPISNIDFRQSVRNTVMKGSLVRSPFFHLLIFVFVMGYLSAVFFGLELLTKGKISLDAIYGGGGAAKKNR